MDDQLAGSAPDIAAELAARLIPDDATLAAELARRIERRPDVLAEAEVDMEAAERALVREALAYLEATKTRTCA